MGISNCEISLQVSHHSTFPRLHFVAVLLLLRVHALYGRSRKVLILLSIFYILTYISILGTATTALVRMIPQLTYSHLAGICAVSEKPVTLQAVWAAPVGDFLICSPVSRLIIFGLQLAFEILVFGMTFHKCLEHAKAQQLQIPLLKTLYRDGFLYFLVRI